MAHELHFITDKSAVPPVREGWSRDFIVAVRRAHHGDEVFTFAAQYLNAMPLTYEDGCGREDCPTCNDERHDGDCPTSGWFTETSDGEYARNFAPLIAPGDELVAWAEIPQYQPDEVKA